MAGIAAALGAASAPLTIEYSGGTVTLGQIEITKVIDAMDEYLAERERRRLSTSWEDYVERGKMTPEEMYRRADAFVDECVNAGRYGFGSKRMMRIFNAAVNPDAGVPIVEFGKFLSLLMGVSQDEAIRIYAEKKKEIHEKLLKVIKVGLPTPEESDDAPKETGA